MNQREKLSDHDLLVCIDVKLSELRKQFTNHLSHHWGFTLAAVGIAFSAITTLCVYITTH